MNILIVLAHPNPGSFNHAIAETAADAARRLGHQVAVRDLYAVRFDPNLPAAELDRHAALPDWLAAEVQEACVADALVFVHPNYWSRPPAILCGWIDRVFRPGRAYNFVPDGQGGVRPEGLLQAQVGIVFNTANTPQEKEETLFGDPLEIHWRKVVFGLTGVPRVYRRNFAPVIVSTPEQRATWLAEVASTIERELLAVA